MLFLTFSAASLWAQGSAVQGAAPAAEDRMLVPTPVGTDGYSLAVGSEATRSNYLRGGVGVGMSYDDNTMVATTGKASDVSYSVWPTISLDQTRSRLHWNLAYNPGFTFYQKESSLNQVDHNLVVDFKYRLSPHVTVSLRDAFAKLSAFTSQFDQSNAGGNSGVVIPSGSIIPPIADRINNLGQAEITYQFGPNAMVGVKGTFSDLRYLHREDTPGFFDSSGRGGQVFYTHRLSGKHYLGTTYQYQVLTAYPGDAQTISNSVQLFYTYYWSPTFSMSVFGGPQYTDTQANGSPSLRMWSPSAGASIGWQGPRTSFSVDFSRQIAEGGGLPGAVQAYNTNLAVNRQWTRNLNMAVGGNYVVNNVLDSLNLSNNGGHSISGNVSLQRPLGQHLSLQLGYMRLHQSYANISSLAGGPDRNRVWVSLAYQFERPLGR